VNTQQKLTAAQERLIEIECQIAGLRDKRRAKLLANDSAALIVGVDRQIDDFQALARIEADRIEGLAEEIRKQEVAAVIKQKEAKIARIERTLAGSIETARELEQTIGRAIELFHAIVKKRVETLPVFQLGDSEVALATNSHEGAALTASSVAALLSFELFRQGHRVVTVSDVPVTEPSWPKPLCPRMDLQLTPEKIPSLSTALARASRYAVSLMRGGRAPSLLAETPGETRSPAQVKLADLLKRQAELAADPSREAEYMELMKEITTLTDTTEAERQALTSTGV
jgi:hypothetical protein